MVFVSMFSSFIWPTGTEAFKTTQTKQSSDWQSRAKFSKVCNVQVTTRDNRLCQQIAHENQVTRDLIVRDPFVLFWGVITWSYKRNKEYVVLG